MAAGRHLGAIDGGRAVNTDSVFLFVLTMMAIAVGIGLLGLIFMAYLIWKGA